MKYLIFCFCILGCFSSKKLPPTIAYNVTEECVEYLEIFRNKVWIKNSDGFYSIDLNTYNNSKLNGKYNLFCLKGLTEEDAIEYFGEPNFIKVKEDVYRQLVYYLDYPGVDDPLRWKDKLFVHIDIDKTTDFSGIVQVSTYPQILNEPEGMFKIIL